MRTPHERAGRPEGIDYHLAGDAKAIQAADVSRREALMPDDGEHQGGDELAELGRQELARIAWLLVVVHVVTQSDVGRYRRVVPQ
jgi:hypothetical protein